MKHTKFKTSLVAASFAILALASFGSKAAVINGQFIQGVNQIEDTDVERIVDSTGAVKTSGNFAVGDTIQTILRWNTVNATMISDPLPSPYQLTTYAELTVSSITDLGGGVSDITFAPSGNLGAGVFANIYERTSAAQPSFNQTVAPSTGIANVMGQTLLAQLGIGEADDFWTVRTLLDIAAAAGLDAQDPQVSNGQFGLSVLTNPGNLPIQANGIVGADGNLHAVVGNASAYQRGPGINTGWLVGSNTTAQFNVPEPGPIALLGLGLAVMGGLSLARKKS